MSQFLYLISISILLNFCYSRTSIWVDNTASCPGNGTEQSPFCTITSAFKGLNQSYSTANYEFEILLTPTDSNYEIGNETIRLKPKLSLTIRSSIPGDLYSQTICTGKYPKFLFQNLLISTIDSLKIRDLCFNYSPNTVSEFRIFRASTAEFINFGLDMKENREIYNKSHAIIQTEEVKNITMTSISIERGFPYQPFFEATNSINLDLENIAIRDLNAYRFEGVRSLFNVSESGDFSATNIRISTHQSDTAGGYFYFRGLKRSRIDGVTIQGNANIIRSYFSFFEVTTLNITNINMDTKAEKIESDMFSIQNSARLNISKIKLNNSIVSSGIGNTFSVINFAYGVSKKPLEWNQTQMILKIDSIEIKDTELNQVSFLSATIRANENHDLHPEFHLSNTNFTNSILKFTKLINLDFIWTESDSKPKANVTRFFFFHSSFSQSKALVVKSVSELKLTTVSLNKMEFFNDQMLTEYLFDIVALTKTEVNEFKFGNSNLTRYMIFYISQYCQNFLVTKSRFVNTTFTSAGIVKMDYTSVKGKPFLGHFILFIEETSFERVNVNNSDAISLVGPFLFVVDCTFSDIILYSGTFFSPKGTDDWTYTIKNFSSNYNEIANYSKRLENLLQNDSNPKTKDIKTDEIQFRFENNSFTNCIMNNDAQIMQKRILSVTSSSFIDIHKFDRTNSYVILFNNKFQAIGTGYTENTVFIAIDSSSNVKIIHNYIDGIKGNASWIQVERLMNTKKIMVSNNTLKNSTGPGFINVFSTEVDTFFFINNSFSESNIRYCYVESEIMKVTLEFEFSQSHFRDISLQESGDGCLISIKIEEAHSVVRFQEIHVTQMEINSEDKSYWQLGQEKYSVVVLIQEGKIVLSNSTFEGYDNNSKIGFLILLCPIIEIINTKIKIFGESQATRVLYIFSNEILIRDVLFLDNAKRYEYSEYSFLRLESLDYNQTQISILNGNFTFYQEASSELLSFGDTRGLPKKMNISFQNNSIKSYSQSQNKTLLSFTNTEFVNFEINGNNLSWWSGKYLGPFIGISNCSGSAPVKQTQIYFFPRKIGFVLCLVRSSPKVELQVSYLQISGELGTKNRLNFDYFLLVDSDGGNMTFQNMNMSGFLVFNPIFLIRSENLRVQLTLINVKISDFIQRHSSLSVIDDDLNETVTKDYTNGGFIYIENRNKTGVAILNCSFHKMRTNSSGGALNVFSNSHLNLNIENSSFSRIQSLRGSALSIDLLESGDDEKEFKQMIEIQNSSFMDCFAKSEGGAMYARNAEINFTGQNTFKNNTASIAGASVQFFNVSGWKSITKSLPRLEDGPLSLEEVGLGPVKFRIKLRKVIFEKYATNGEQIIIENVTSYELNPISLELIDELNRTVVDLSRSRRVDVIFETTDNIKTISSSIYSSCNQTMCLMSGIDLAIGGYQGDIEKILIVYSSERSYLNSTLLVRFRDCVRGEIKTISKAKGCQLCPYGKYSLDINDIKCHQCPKQAEICRGGANIEVREGYWRRNIFTNEIIPCHRNNDTISNSRCEGGYYSRCKKGFEGPVCHQCNLREGYVRQGSETHIDCKTCSSSIWSMYLIALAVFFGFWGYELYYIRTAITTGQLYYKASVDGTSSAKNSFGPYISIITTYFQIISIVSSFEIDAFKYIFYFTSIIGEPSAKTTSFLDCIFLHWKLNPESFLNYRIIILLAGPLAKLLIMVIYCIVRGLNRERKMMIVVSSLSLFLLEQPQIIKGLIGYINCRKLVDTDTVAYVMGDEFFACQGEQYNFFKYIIVLPAAAFFCLLPLFILWILYKKYKQEKLDTELMRCTLGIFYNGLKSKSYYWVIIVIYSKVGLITINLCYSQTYLLKIYSTELFKP